jgi:ribosome-binding ATPase YchF (GTP1/OBG family)
MTKNNSWLPTEKNIEDYHLLKDMLIAQKHEFDILSSKKSDGQLNKMKIKMVNRVLEPLNELFKNETSHKFLDVLKEDEMPTNSDVVLIISQYEKALNNFKDKYWARDASAYGGPTYRWNTKENPVL